MNEHYSKADNDITLVLVTDQFACERLIVAGRKLVKENSTTLEILSIASPNQPQNPEAIEHLYKISRENGGNMAVHYSDKPLKSITSALENHAITHVVTGLPQQENSVLRTLWEKFHKTKFYTVDNDGNMQSAKLSIGF